MTEHTFRVYRIVSQHVMLEPGDPAHTGKDAGQWQHIDHFIRATGLELVCVTYVPNMRNYEEPGGYAFFRKEVR